MPSSNPATAPDASHPDAGQLLTRLAALIGESKTIADITPERVQAAMGVEVETFGPGHYGFGKPLTSAWSVGLEVEQSGVQGPRLDFNFRETQGQEATPATDICKVDFDKFSSALEAMSFVRQTIHGEHDRVIEYRFNRPGLDVTVGIQGEANDPVEKISHACVTMVVVR